MSRKRNRKIIVHFAGFLCSKNYDRIAFLVCAVCEKTKTDEKQRIFVLSVFLVYEYQLQLINIMCNSVFVLRSLCPFLV